jgi:hypothetical protein
MPATTATVQMSQPAVRGQTKVLQEIERLGLERHILEIETYGLTVIPPEKHGAAALVDRAWEKVLDLCEQRAGVRPDTATGSTHTGRYFLPALFYLIFKDRVFEELLMNETALAVVTYFLGESCVLNGSSVFMKGPQEPSPDGRLQLGLHSDMMNHPEPFPTYAQHMNTTWLLTDYSKEEGALAWVPGSHLSCRHPLGDDGLAQAVPVEARKGSLVIWHGNTWHGSYYRTVPGLRAGMAYEFVRGYIRTVEPYRENVPREILDRNPPRFAKLMGQHLHHGWMDEGPDMKKLGTGSVRTLWD